MRPMNYKEKLDKLRRILNIVDMEYCHARDDGDDYIAIPLTPQARRYVELAGYHVRVGVYCDFIYV